MRLKELQEKQIKRQSLAKIQWGVRAFQEWRMHKLQELGNYDPIVFETDLENVEGLIPSNLCHALCMFIPEVMKVKDGAPYPGQTLYQLIIAIQRYLNEKGIGWKLIGWI